MTEKLVDNLQIGVDANLRVWYILKHSKILVQKLVYIILNNFEMKDIIEDTC